MTAVPQGAAVSFYLAKDVCIQGVSAPTSVIISNPAAQIEEKLKDEDDPPCIHQHNQSAHTHVQTIASACLPVPHTPIFHDPLELFSYQFHNI
jgi:hypothetical protein